jgi:16S rRNA (adenine1518-N6/adenine1519-N6)-dimethyltransferase
MLASDDVAADDAHTAGDAARALRDRYRRAGIRPTKRLGQHFLADLNLARKIVAEVGPPGAGPVVEIGAGLGALTFLLAAAGHSGVAIEIDRRLATWLAEGLAPWPRIQVVRADIRTLDLPGLAGQANRVRVVGNLPYYLTSEVLFKLVRAGTSLASAVIMIQDDVAARLLAPPGTRAYGSLTVAMALRFTSEMVLRVPRQAFWPAPEVDSAVLRLNPRRQELSDHTWIERVVRAGFSQRRKTLARSLAAGLDVPRPAVEVCLRRLGLDPSRRAETLAPDDFVRLATALADEHRERRNA